MILGLGTVALDTVETPVGAAREVPGGSALYFGAAASTMAPVALVGVTGADFPAEPLARLMARGVDVSGIVRLEHPTFRWHARYDATGRREVLSVHRGTVVRTAPPVPMAFRDPAILFLGSTDPEVQQRVLDGSGAPGRVVLDTMPHWIRDCRRQLEGVLQRTDILLTSQEEIGPLGGDPDEERAARALRSAGPSWVVVTRGAEGARAYGDRATLEVDAVAAGRVVDPTGAGDAFAGGLVASLAQAGDLSAASMRRALSVGAEMGARAVSDFSFRGLLEGG